MTRPAIAAVLLLSVASLAAMTIAAEPSEQASPTPTLRVEEARGRARLLHETLHGTLQVMHRDFFDEEESHAIPSRSLEDVFAELERIHHVKVRWISVNTNAMNIDNEPQSPFEKSAAKELAAGKPEHDAVADGRYQYAGAIRLASRCLKCHVPNRKSTESRIAGLVISMPIAEEK